MNEITKVEINALAAVQSEAEAIAEAAGETAGFQQLLKFKKGPYECGVDEQTGLPKEIPHGTELIAHCGSWMRCWLKFVDGELVDRKLYPVPGPRPPDREELDDLDKRDLKGPNGMSADPWVFQFVLPMESSDGEFQALFVTASMGGMRAVGDLCRSYSRRMSRTGVRAQPIIKLGQAFMPTKFGKVPRPLFTIIGWDENIEGVRVIKAPDTLKEQNPFDDQIPF